METCSVLQVLTFCVQVMKSCVLLYKAGQTCEQAPAELCCTTADKQVQAWLA